MDTRCSTVSLTSTFERPLLAFVTAHLVPADYRRTREIARMAWAEALGSLHLSADAGIEEEGIPIWLASAVRRVVRREISPAHYAAQLVSVRRPTSAGLAATDSPVPLAA
ncbi:hypothetical protein [Streptomyces sp. NPDC101150]|uniref:hypothetical protein n=1 Tax=Streptomyces sp. NPDC101150 TaxID=3366114 RepID=UPI00382286D7